MIRPVQREGRTVYQVYIQAGGKKKYVTTCDTQRLAQEAEEDARVTQRKVERGELAPQTDTRRTFGDAVKIWLRDLEEKGSRSLDEYAERVKLHINPTFERVPLVEIRREHIEVWRNKLGAMVSAARVNTILGTLSSAFSFFVDARRWLDVNPCMGVERLEAKGKVFPWLRTSEAVTTLLGECTPNIQSLVAFLVGTGCRLDEALHIRWTDVDLEHRIVMVHRGRKGTTKSGKPRAVPIFDSVLVVLKQMKLARGNNVFLWPGGIPGKPLSQPAVRAPFKAALERADLPLDMRLHDLRHSFAGLFLADGGDIFKLSKILGHSSVAVTEKTYAHLKPEAYAEDYGRVSFRLPSNANVVELRAV